MPLIHAAFLLSSCAAESKAPRIPIWSENTELRVERQRQRVFVTPDLHDLVVLTEPEVQGETKLIPNIGSLHNGLKPTVGVNITPPADISRGDRFHYEYVFGNGATARDNITSALIVLPAFAPGTDAGYDVEGKLWIGFVSPGVGAKQRELDESIVGKEAMWAAMWTEELANSESVNIRPGRTKNGFVVDSSLMPGFTTAALQGLSYEPPGQIDSETLAQFIAFQVDNYADVTILTFGPMFLIGAEPADVLQNYRLGLQKLGRCAAIPHSAAFLGEMSLILDEPRIESRLAERLAQMKAKPTTPIEVELMNCLRLVARGFSMRGSGGRY
jgi:hypothetical protein